jgi:hypothetical protein
MYHSEVISEAQNSTVYADIYFRFHSHTCTFFVNRCGLAKQMVVPVHVFPYGLSACLVSHYIALNGRTRKLIIHCKKCCRLGLGTN